MKLDTGHLNKNSEKRADHTPDQQDVGADRHSQAICSSFLHRFVKKHYASKHLLPRHSLRLAFALTRFRDESESNPHRLYEYQTELPSIWLTWLNIPRANLGNLCPKEIPTPSL